MNIDPSNPAYPVFYTHNSPGLTKREELIFRIASGLAANPSLSLQTQTIGTGHFAMTAIAIADAVLAEINMEKV